MYTVNRLVCLHLSGYFLYRFSSLFPVNNRTELEETDTAEIQNERSSPSNSVVSYMCSIFVFHGWMSCHFSSLDVAFAASYLTTIAC